MHKLTRLFVANWQRQLAYRGEIFMWTLAEVATPLVALAIWYTVAQSGQTPLTGQETLTYYLIAYFVYSFTDVWNGYFLATEILKGTILQFLLRPVPFFWHYIFRNVTAKLIRLPGIVIIFAFLLVAFTDSFSSEIYELENIIPFVVSLVGGLGIAFWMDMNFAMLAFWLEDAVQIRQYKEIVFNITSGLLIPFAFFPAFVQSAFNWLPFRYIIAAPIEILLGHASGALAWQLIALQALWIGVFTILLRILWRRGLSIYAIPGQ